MYINPHSFYFVRDSIHRIDEKFNNIEEI